MTTSVKTIIITVKGKVQGVYFRQSTKNVAGQLQITGTVSNQQDGSVLITATGTPDRLRQFVEWAHKGPPGATVHNVQVTDAPLQTFQGFRIVRL